jgi:alpha-1,3-mannosyltransferase
MSRRILAFSAFIVFAILFVVVHLHSEQGYEIFQSFREAHCIRAVNAILDPSDTSVSRLSCPPLGPRYDHLKVSNSSETEYGGTVKYFFALNLFNCASVLPSLLGAVVEAMRFLGAEHCALSIVEGRSTDDTYDILVRLRENLDERFYLATNDINPRNGSRDRIAALAELRNLALKPLIEEHGVFASDAVVIFLNDVVLCAEDVLELIHQQVVQSADMTCAMDWNYKMDDILFYDVWVARGISGDTFFEVPQNSAWYFSSNLFWDDPKSKQKLDARESFQVYACWNGVTVFRAKPIMDEEIMFRRSSKGECVMGEPTLFCKDLWRKGMGKIQVVPTVNVAYNVREGRITRGVRGTVDQHVEDVLIDWQLTPPPMVKCAQTWEAPSWVSPL